MSANESEEQLGKLSRDTFLSMWSYQNPFYEGGKELCDLLIVFGEDVIVISDKVISYAQGKTPAVAWSRWYKKAVAASVAQLRGALKTIKSRPQAIHLDAKVSSPFPLTFPDPNKARYYLVAVAQGAEKAGATQFGRPSIAVDSNVCGDEVMLTVGVRFGELFVHVLTQTAMHAMFECFDTTADFVRYLSEKAALFSAGCVYIPGEEDLIALYMKGRRPDGSSSLRELVAGPEGDRITVPGGLWATLQADPAFVDRRIRLGPSYVVDDVIEQLASEYRQGRVRGQRAAELAYHAAAFQLLAAESRMARVLMAQGVVDVLSENPSTFWSAVVESLDQPGVLYLWLVYPVVDGSVSDDELEDVVGGELADYIVVAMSKFSSAHTVFGIAMPNAEDSRMSRVFQMYKRNVWTDVMQRQAEELGRSKGILRKIESTTYVALRPI